MNARLKEQSPHAPDDDFSEPRWDRAVCDHADEIVRKHDVAEVVGDVADYGTWLALFRARTGERLDCADLDALARLEQLCWRTHNAVQSRYDAPEEA